MASGWGCQHLGKNNKELDWCNLLKYKCDPGCKGCVLNKAGVFTTQKPNFDETKKPKNRSDNPFGRK
ncbi:MAG: hypothetical protein WC253_03890 [Sulfurovaceae bacterium]|nr:hypothetical protein [Sulfurovaceae bacterium]